MLASVRLHWFVIKPLPAVSFVAWTGLLQNWLFWYNIHMQQVYRKIPVCSISASNEIKWRFQILKNVILIMWQSFLTVVIFAFPLNFFIAVHKQNSFVESYTIYWYVDLLHTHTHNRLTALCLGLPGWASTRRNIYPLTPILIIRYPLSTSSIYYSL